MIRKVVLQETILALDDKSIFVATLRAFLQNQIVPSRSYMNLKQCMHVINPTDTAYTAKSLSHGQHMVTSILATPNPFFETMTFATKSIGSPGKLVLLADERALAEVAQSWAFTQIAGLEKIIKQLLFILN